MFVKIPYVPQDSFSFLQLGGFILLVFGTLVYNEIIILRFGGFDHNTKSAREQRSKRSELLDSSRSTGAENNYVAVSPHAAYDAARNKRKVAMKID